VKGDELTVGDRDSVLAHFAKRKPSTPITVLGVAPREPNSAAGVDMDIVVRNTDPRRAIKYMYFTVTPYNAVGDVVRSSIGGETAKRLQVTGPIEPDGKFEWRHWNPVWYNSSITCVVLNSVSITFMDGTTRTFAQDVRTILHPVVRNNCSYRAQKQP
jgi:hypothetical protein